jgi:SMC interacting uncharacterized protein involved in chromosome segregation
MHTRPLYIFLFFALFGLFGCRERTKDSDALLNRVVVLEASIRQREADAEALQKRVSEIGEIVSRLESSLATSEKKKNQQIISVLESFMTSDSSIRVDIKEIELSISELKSALDLVEAELATKSSELTTSEQIRELRALIRK